MGQFSTTQLFGMTIRESADDGSDFTNPAADYRRLFLGEDGQLHVKDSSGTVTQIGGSGTGMATDPLWDAAGDLAQGTGANTGAKLSAGTAGQFLMAQGSSTAVAWKSRELDYVEITSPVTISGTIGGTPTTCITGNAVSYDGSTVIIVEVFAPYLQTPANSETHLYLFDGTSNIGRMALWLDQQATADQYQPVYASRRLTPSNASHTYSIRGARTSTTTTLGAGAGGSASDYMPAFIRITRAV